MRKPGGGLGVDKFRDTVDSYGIGVRAGVITPQSDDEDFFRQQAGLPAPSEHIRKTWKDEPVRRPITLAISGGGTKPGAPPTAADTTNQETP
jgi:hypothetical protein